MGGELLKKPEVVVLCTLVHLLVTMAQLTRPSGIRSVVAESIESQRNLLSDSRRCFIWTTAAMTSWLGPSSPITDQQSLLSFWPILSHFC